LEEIIAGIRRIGDEESDDSSSSGPRPIYVGEGKLREVEGVDGYEVLQSHGDDVGIGSDPRDGEGEEERKGQRGGEEEEEEEVEEGVGSGVEKEEEGDVEMMVMD
jgi:hypothetical protein